MTQQDTNTRLNNVNITFCVVLACMYGDVSKVVKQNSKQERYLPLDFSLQGSGRFQARLYQLLFQCPIREHKIGSMGGPVVTHPQDNILANKGNYRQFKISTLC